MKIAIYTPFLNEEDNAEAWALSCADADYRVTINTGSSDRTAEILEFHGVLVYNVVD
jgi:cellulose synthase/poly-beta-1,6-N-acetylglucosamine synthase-like glycosyltransferase